MPTKILIGACATLITCAGWAHDARIKWGVSGGMNHYQEHNLMQLKGPEVGLHAQLSQWSAWPDARLEADVLLGKQTYTSNGSGSMRNVTNLETRWRAMVPAFQTTAPDTGWSAGLAVHTLWNDLRGTSSFNGVTYGGYERIAMQLWLPLRWVSGEAWEVEGGWLLYGRHSSMLSQVNTRYQDIHNTQRRGQYAQASMQFALSGGDTLKPFVRYTYLADSNTVTMNGKKWLEPESHRWQVGAVWEFSGP